MSLLEAILLVAFTGVLWAVVGVLISQAGSRGGDVFRFHLIMASLVSLQSWALCDWGALASGNIPAASKFIPTMIVCGAIGCVGTFTLILAMRLGPQAITWTVAQSCMIVPFLAGILIWREPIHPASIVGMAMIIGGIILLGQRHREVRVKHAGSHWFALTLLSFAAAGLSQAISTAPSYWPGWVDEARLRVPLGSSTSMMIVATVNLLRPKVKWSGEWRVAVPCAMVSLIGSFGLYASMDKLAQFGKVAIVYPMCVAICVLGFAAYSRIWLNERLGTVGGAGFLLCLAGIILMGL